MPSSWAERILGALFEYQEIRDGCEAGTRTDGLPYLKRYYIVRHEANKGAYVQSRPRLSLTWHRKTDGVQLYLHHILRSDADPELHDHPWSFLSLILWGGYREETEAWARVQMAPTHREISRKWPGMALFRPATHRHRLILKAPAWTLVFTSGKKRSWGFWRDGNFIPWRWFVARKCEGAK